MKKSLMSIAVIAFTMVSLFAGSKTAKAAETAINVVSKEIRVSSFQELKETLASEDKNTTIVLDDDISFSDANTDYKMVVSAQKKTVVLDLNGHSLGLLGDNVNAKTQCLFEIRGNDNRLYVVNSNEKRKSEIKFSESYADGTFALFQSTAAVNSNTEAAAPACVYIVGSQVEVDFYAATENQGFVFAPSYASSTNYCHIAAYVYGATINARGLNGNSKSAVLGETRNGDRVRFTAAQNAKIETTNASFYSSYNYYIGKEYINLYQGSINVSTTGSRKMFLLCQSNGAYSDTLENLKGSTNTIFKDSNSTEVKSSTLIGDLKGYLAFNGTSYTLDTTQLNATTCHVKYANAGNAVKVSSHEGTATVKKAATCLTRGEQEVVCSVCDFHVKQEIPCEEHVYKRVLYAPATCENVGNVAYAECTKCHKFIADEDRFEVAAGPSEYLKDTNKEFLIAKEQHKLTHFDAQAATCTKEGNKEYYFCSSCKGYYDTKECKEKKGMSAFIAKATGHQWKAEKVNDTNHKKTCENCKESVVEKHTWNAGVVTKKATYDEKGVKTYTCATCKATKTEEIAILEAVKGAKVEDTASKGVYQIENIDKKEVSYVASKNASATNVVVPATIKVAGVDYKVVKIANNAFANDSKIVKVTIGSNVTEIGNKAFYKCKKLKKVVIPASVKKIGKSAFEGDKKLSSIVIKTTVLKSKTVGAKAFKGIHAKVKVKVPKNKVGAYKKLLKKKGLTGKKQKVTK